MFDENNKTCLLKLKKYIKEKKTSVSQFSPLLEN